MAKEDGSILRVCFVCSAFTQVFEDTVACRQCGTRFDQVVIQHSQLPETRRFRTIVAQQSNTDEWPDTIDWT